MSIKSVDDLLVSNMNPEVKAPEPQAPEAADAEPMEDNVTEVTEPLEDTKESEDYEEPPLAAEAKDETPEVNDVDEYGNPTAKPKMYSEEEVQRMIRERLQRGNHQQATPQQAQQAAQDFTADPNSDESWETQLDNYIDKRLEKRQTEAQQRDWQEREKKVQIEFESKFTAGMSKYEDFHKVVGGQPVTDSMMLATRSMENPAAFLYAAAKVMPQELDRISKIGNPLMQAAEIGRLDVKLRKVRNASTKAGKPIAVDKGDSITSKPAKNNIDHLINLDAKRRRRG